MTGVFLVNFGSTLAILWVGIMAWVLWRAGTDSTAPIWPVVTAAVVIGAGAPVVLYPRAASTWAALDLVMRPLEPEEEAEAATFVASQH